jgi:hypothetical protein
MISMSLSLALSLARFVAVGKLGNRIAMVSTAASSS